MTDETCPCCDRLSLGGQVVELSHPNTTDVTYAVACQHCGTVFASEKARQQILATND